MQTAPMDHRLLELVERARRTTEFRLRSASGQSPSFALKDALHDEFSLFNDRRAGAVDDGTWLAQVDEVRLTELHEDAPHTQRSHTGAYVGGAMVVAGMPILRKRFVMQGSAAGTSIASKYLSQALPQKLPFRVMRTTVLGRALGRLVPYAGWALIAVDAVEMAIETIEGEEQAPRPFVGGGGRSGGAGASGSW